MGYAVDENGTTILGVGSGGFTKDNSEAWNSARVAAAAETQNELYEKEIKEIRQQGTIAKWAAITSAFISFVSLVIQILKD